MITTATTPAMQEPISLADVCRWPAEFPRFVARQLDIGCDVERLLEDLWKWDVEFAQFLAGVNVVSPASLTQPISDWLESEIGAKVVCERGGTAERPVVYREIGFYGPDGEIINQAVADFTDYDATNWDQPELKTGAKYQFALSLVGGERQSCEATAHVERKHGRLIVTFELEACR